MQELNLKLFQLIAAGFTPNPLLLSLASVIAIAGFWISVALLAWAVWRHRSQRGYLLAIAVTCGVAGFLSHAIAASLHWSRPFVLGLSPSYIQHGARGSLPSAHATVMFTLALAFLVRPSLWRLGVLMTASAMLTSWARVYVGVHFPIDIAAGFLLAAGIVGVLCIVMSLGNRYLVPSIGRVIKGYRTPKPVSDPKLAPSQRRT